MSCAAAPTRLGKAGAPEPACRRRRYFRRQVPLRTPISAANRNVPCGSIYPPSKSCRPNASPKNQLRHRKDCQARKRPHHGAVDADELQVLAHLELDLL